MEEHHKITFNVSMYSQNSYKDNACHLSCMFYISRKYRFLSIVLYFLHDIVPPVTIYSWVNRNINWNIPLKIQNGQLRQLQHNSKHEHSWSYACIQVTNRNCHLNQYMNILFWSDSYRKLGENPLPLKTKRLRGQMLGV